MKPIFRQALAALALLLLLPFAAIAQPTPPSGEVIGYWGFDSTNLHTAYGLPPLTASNLTLVPDWSGNALQVDATNASLLVYPVSTALADGKIATNITFSAGSIEFWFAPNWDSGTGPGCWGRLLEVADPAAPTNLASAWGLYVSPDGTGLYFSARTNTLRTNFAAASISWNYGEWHYLIAAYDASTNGVTLYVDGQLAASNTNGMTVLPTAAAISNGFALGSDLATGLKQMHGQMDELWTYDYALDAVTVSNNYAWLAQFVYPLPSTRRGFGTMDAPSFPVDGGDDGGDDGSTNTVPPWNPAVMFAADFRLGVAPPGTNAWNPYDPNGIVIILNQTTNTSVYQLWSTTNLVPPVSWTVEQTVLGNPATNWTAFIVDVGTNAQKFYTAINYTQDTDGGGLPDWWQMKYFGHLGNDPYGDPMGDGYSNLYKYQNGMNPNVFYQPPAPTGFTANLNTNGSIIFNWPAVGNLPASPGAGNLSNYSLGFSATSSSSATNISISSGATNYVANSALDPDLYGYLGNYLSYFPQGSYYGAPPAFAFNANYVNVTSAALSNQIPFDASCSVNATVARGPQGALFLAASAIPANVIALRVLVTPLAIGFPINWELIYADTNAIIRSPSNTFSYGNFIGLNYFDVPVGSFTNGLYPIPAAQAPLFEAYYFTLLGVGANGNLGFPSYGSPTNDQLNPFYDYTTTAIPFVDGRSNIQQNINILLRGADNLSPFGISLDGGWVYPNGVATNYVYSGFYFEYDDPYNPSPFSGVPAIYPQRDEFEPFEDNSLYQYFAFNPANFNGSGELTNGVNVLDYGGNLDVDDPRGLYLAYQYATNHPSLPMSAIPPLTTPAGTEWLLPPNFDNGSVVQSGANFSVPTGIKNIYGLALTSLKYWAAGGSFGTAYPGGTYAGNPLAGVTPLYQEVAQPALVTVDYYFARPNIDPMPGDLTFKITNATPSPLVIPLGQPFQLTAWARQAITNGYSNVFAFPQQYFNQALLADTTGSITTNQTGILSEYGEFFPTQPGKVFLTTKADVATGSTGQLALNVIKLQLDVNHDGVMDTSFSGPDNTSAYRPFVFWANNNFDRWNEVDCNLIGADCDSEQDDLPFASCPFTPLNPTPDCNFLDSSGNRQIPSTRDLEDFTRLWVLGVDSNLLASLPTNSTVTLSWADANSSNPTIDLFLAADSDGGMGYLTNATSATNQITQAVSPYLGRVAPGRGILLNAATFTGHWAGNHFIWCGVSNGTGGLTLTIANGSGTILAQATANIQILDIKQMYERWSVGDNPANAPLSTAYLAANDLPPGTARFRYDLPSGTNTPYVLHVHGFNMATWEKDRYAETEFKRLYWQGYQGRFGCFRWPTPPFNFIGNPYTTARAFDYSEQHAWQSASALNILLTGLNVEYPGNVYLTAHSHGNVVAGEALRLAGTNVIVNTYIAMQAAVASHSYDPTTPLRILTTLGVDADSDTPNRYAQYYTNGAPSYFFGIAGAGGFVNFFNTNDWALTVLWQPDQNLKPDVGYGYDTNSDQFFHGTLGSANLNFPADTYTIFAYCDEARCFALGAQLNVGGPFKPLTEYQQVDLQQSPYNFGSQHKFHSGEFRSDFTQRWQFWNQALKSFELKTP